MLWLSKHYYNGSRRIATQTGTPSWLPSGTIVGQGADSYVETAQMLMSSQLDMFSTKNTQDTATYRILDIDGYESGLLTQQCQGDQVELDKWNKNELNSIDKENIVRDNYKCEERPYNYVTNEEY